MNKEDRIYVAGHTGLVGSALLRRLQNAGYAYIVTRRSSGLDLRRQEDVEQFFEAERPEYVFLAAARVGGILANNTYRAQFAYDNLLIGANVIHASYQFGVKKLVNLGSSCIYPRLAEQPMREDSLLTGPLEQTNEPYAIAKIAALKLCRYYNEQYGTNFISVMPTNLFGPNDNFDLETSHVLPALVRKFHEATDSGGPVVLWGDGSPRREFLYADDLADAIVYLATRYDAADLGQVINVGVGEDIPIRELAELVAEIVGYEGPVEWDTTKPNGTPRKLLDVSRLHALGWRARMSLRDGIARTYEWFLRNEADA